MVPTPAVKEIARDAETDEWLVIASDGLWDTVNSTACATFISQECKKNPGMRADAPRGRAREARDSVPDAG